MEHPEVKIMTFWTAPFLMHTKKKEKQWSFSTLRRWFQRGENW